MNKSDNNINIITLEEANSLIKQGYNAIDPHCHSAYSYDVPDVKDTSPESIIHYQKSRGLMPIITDHDNINAYNYLKSKDHRILPAVEITFRPKIAKYITTQKPIQTLHVNVFGLSSNDLIVLKEITQSGNLDEFVKYLKDNDLDYMYNHPFYHEKRERLNWRVIPELTKHYFDVVELNSTHSKGLNDINQRIAEKLNKGVIASSDSHTGTPGKGFFVAEGKNFKEMWENVKNNNAFIVRKDMGTWDIVREASLIFSQAFHARKYPRIGRKYTPSTNVQPIDDIMKSVTSGKLRNWAITKKALHLTLQSLNYTAGPILAWKLHVTKNEEKAEKIRHRINLITDKIKEIKKSIKKDKNKTINKHKYYSKHLIKRNSDNKT